MLSTPLLLSLKLASLSTLILLMLGVPLACWLAQTRWRIKPVLETLITMPLVLPPSVLGFYFLLAFNPQHGLGSFLIHHFNLRLVFSFAGLLVASIIFSLPFLVHPVLAGFQSLPATLSEAAQVLGKSRMTIFFRVWLPNLRPALLSGTVLAFAHALGEFGAVLMIGGNLPNQTRTASIAIYEAVETGNLQQAHHDAAILLALSFGIVLIMRFCNTRQRP